MANGPTGVPDGEVKEIWVVLSEGGIWMLGHVLTFYSLLKA